MIIVGPRTRSGARRPSCARSRRAGARRPPWSPGLRWPVQATRKPSSCSRVTLPAAGRRRWRCSRSCGQAAPRRWSPLTGPGVPSRSNWHCVAGAAKAHRRARATGGARRVSSAARRPAESAARCVAGVRPRSFRHRHHRAAARPGTARQPPYGQSRRPCGRGVSPSDGAPPLDRPLVAIDGPAVPESQRWRRR